MSNFPFYYKTKFHLITRDKENNIDFHNTEKEFSNPDPFKARKEAFEEFEEYLNFLKQNKKLEEDEIGNYKIISPTGLPQAPEIDKLENEEDLAKNIQALVEYMDFKEEIEVLLVINDDELMEEMGSGDRVFAIHSVASHLVNSQELIGNLELVELELYRRCGRDIEKHTKQVQHYGIDYEESGEDEEAAHWTILPTPHIWQTKEQYLAITNEEEKPAEPDLLTYEKIINGGETNTVELKSSLAYNFISEAPNYIPLFNNAKTIAGFLNSNGGLLIIGVGDDGTLQGIEKDYELLGNKDKIRLKVDDLISTFFRNTISSLIDVSFETVADKEILVISVKPGKTPVFLNNYNRKTNLTSKHFFTRRNASTTELKDVEEIITYIFNHEYLSKI